VTFSRGIIEGQDQLWKWQRFIHNWQSGVPGSTGGSDYRCDIIVKVYDHPHSNASYNDSVAIGSKTTFIGTPKLGIKLFNCWPGAYAMGGLNAGDNNIMIQEMVLHNEGWILAWTPEDIAALPSAH
jgi:phage tail-like protein